MDALSGCEETMSPSVVVWPQCTNVTDRQTDDRQTDRQACDNTGSWLAMSRQKQQTVGGRVYISQSLSFD